MWAKAGIEQEPHFEYVGLPVGIRIGSGARYLIEINTITVEGAQPALTDTNVR